jgi:pyruvate/2-oxoglutarate dehydrogenase complex dihydrolipoamide acyltransferase (E2) component
MTEVKFPEMSHQNPSAEGVVATWFVSDGETVTQDRVLAEVQVDKVAAEVAAPCSGTVHLTAAEGAVVQQGDPIATIE